MRSGVMAAAEGLVRRHASVYDWVMDPIRDLFERALAEQRAGRATEAVRWYREVVKLDPRHAQAWHQLGFCVLQSGHAREAIDYLVRAIRLDGAQARFHNNLGECFRATGQFQDAVACYRRAIELAPGYVAAAVNLAWALRSLGRLAEADAATNAALALPRAAPDEHCECGALLLSLGQLNAGWVEHEWRLQLPERRPSPSSAPRWDGSPLAGRTLLIQCEQGAGDTLQMVRYVAVVRAAGGKPILAAPRGLVPLLSEADLCPVVPADEPWPAHDLQIATLSLPWACGTTLDNVPNECPYLKVDPARVARWRDRLGEWSSMRVGIQWQGNPAYLFDAQRSLPLSHFAPLAEVPGVQLLSLQKFHGSEQLASWRGASPVVDLGAELDLDGQAFLDTAAVMKNLDLVITSDTATAHLAGALGVPVWVALSVLPEWRWMFHREDSPWYPTMRLFRQQTPGNWSEVFARIASVLSAREAGRSV